jgi:hypothetical protein
VKGALRGQVITLKVGDRAYHLGCCDACGASVASGASLPHVKGALTRHMRRERGKLEVKHR